MHPINFIRSLGVAFTGVMHVLRTEPSMQIHFLAAMTVIAAGAFFRIRADEWIAVLLCIGLVIAMECVNSAVERLADRISMEQHPLIGQAKDAAAGGVLVVSIISAVIGGIVFLPKVWT